MHQQQIDYIEQIEGELEEAAAELKRLRTLVDQEESEEALRRVKYDYLIQAVEFQMVETRRQLDTLKESDRGAWKELQSNLELATDNLKDTLGNLENKVAGTGP